MTNLDSILKSRDITFPTKLHIVKAMFFAIVLYRCESWTIEKAEGWKIDAFELWCWRRLLSPLDTRRSNQSILKEINLEGLMLKLKLQYFGHLMWRDKSLKNPDARKDWGQGEKGATEDELVGWHHQLNGHKFVEDPGDSEGQGGLTSCSPWSHKESDKTERLNSNKKKVYFCYLQQNEWTLRVLCLMKCQTEKQKHCMLSLVCEILKIQHTN